MSSHDQDLAATLDQIARLLRESGYTAKSDWIEERRDVIGRASTEAEHVAATQELRRVIWGMGGLLDLYFESHTVRRTLDGLVERLDHLTAIG